MSKINDVVSTMVLQQIEQLSCDINELTSYKSNTILPLAESEAIERLINGMGEELEERKSLLIGRIEDGCYPQSSRRLAGRVRGLSYRRTVPEGFDGD